MYFIFYDFRTPKNRENHKNSKMLGTPNRLLESSSKIME